MSNASAAGQKVTLCMSRDVDCESHVLGDGSGVGGEQW